MKRKNINCNKFPMYALLLSLWSISARERSSVDPHSELIESYLATCTCFISDRYLPKRTNVREHIVSLISPVCKHLPWQPLGHQPPETNPIHRTMMTLLLLLILPNLSAPVSIFGRIEAIAEKSGIVPRAPISYVEESPDLRLRGEREKNVNKG